MKIDRSISSLPTAPAIPATIAHLAETLGIACMAEGIEREDQWEPLKTMGCGFGQGFLIGRPQPADLAWAFLQASTREGSLRPFADEGVLCVAS
jgi:EAL domain-containing protein (putative c-di-GMP-specific phosphodiesterase class I)